MDFIAAKESRLVIKFFTLYTQFLMWRRFKNVEVIQDYIPQEHSKTIYFLNHNYWWDGLIPLYLNYTRFNQKARAIMEDKQMREYPFFSKIGAFSINLENPRSSLKSLRYAVESMERFNSCLFIYPEGKLVPPSTELPDFRGGLAWLYQNLDSEIDFVPIGIFIDHSMNNKPDLKIYVGKQVSPDKNDSKEELSRFFSKKCLDLVTYLRNN